MEQRLANTWHMTINEKKFIETALSKNIRVDGRSPVDYRQLTIKFGREDGSSEVQLGETHVIGLVSGQIVQPYRDRPNEGTLAIFTEFSPMADPAFEPGRPGEFAIELGRLIDRGLRESRAVDMESLCIVAGKSVWAIRVDLHILDNGGNLIDTANIAALAALLTYRKPECTLGGENGQDVVVHDPEVREPLPLIIHHMPVAVTFAFFNEGDAMVIDPTHKEEAIMGGRMTATLNSNGDVCAVQKAGGDGVSLSVITHCLRLAALKAVDITSKIKNAVDSYNTARALRKVKRHTALVAPDITVPDSVMKDNQIGQLAEHQAQKFKEESTKTFDTKTVVGISKETVLFNKKNINFIRKDTDSFIGGPSNWDPYSQSIPPTLVRSSQISPGSSTVDHKKEARTMQIESNSEETKSNNASSGLSRTSSMSQQRTPPKSLKDAVKLKSERKNRPSSASGVN
ncbi:hypothetical protein KFK09_026696 [Dendrobium nobile]|uniref:Protein ECERIFERUM 7 n=1 Tax=Dendrobium nobile TaxID=94219 RepID=A0A8T3A8U0_DENNO|nr:hypothetical protein KFK09_026696 [Dendrobium nobile]